MSTLRPATVIAVGVVISRIRLVAVFACSWGVVGCGTAADKGVSERVPVVASSSESDIPPALPLSTLYVGPALLPDDAITYFVVKGARFFDILVARIDSREHVVLGENDDMCLDLVDQRDYDGDGARDALLFQSPRCRGNSAPGRLFFVSGDPTFRVSNHFCGYIPDIERWEHMWSVRTPAARYLLRDGRAVVADPLDASERP